MGVQFEFPDAECLRRVGCVCARCCRDHQQAGSRKGLIRSPAQFLPIYPHHSVHQHGTEDSSRDQPSSAGSALAAVRSARGTRLERSRSFSMWVKAGMFPATKLVKRLNEAGLLGSRRPAGRLAAYAIEMSSVDAPGGTPRNTFATTAADRRAQSPATRCLRRHAHACLHVCMRATSVSAPLGDSLASVRCHS